MNGGNEKKTRRQMPASIQQKLVMMKHHCSYVLHEEKKYRVHPHG